MAKLKVWKFFSVWMVLVLVVGLGAALAPAGPVAAIGGTLYVSKWTEQPGNPIFDPAEKAYYPTVVKVSDTDYRMWYGSDSGIGYATSPDGLAWTEQANPVTGLTSANHPLVEYYADGFTGSNSGGSPSGDIMYYRIWYWPGLSYSIGDIRYAESAGGTAWHNDQPLTQVGTTVIAGIAATGWNRGSYGPCDVLYNQAGSDTIVAPVDAASVWANKFVMYYDGTNGGLEDIGLAISADGKYWQGYNGGVAPVLAGGGVGTWDEKYASRCTVLRDGSTYHMLYSGGTVKMEHGIGYAISADGLAWTKDPNNPYLHKSDGVAWRADRTYTPMVIKDGGVYKMWFSGMATDNYAIGYAILNADYATIWAAITAASPGDTINVAAGTYNENISINKSLSLIGADKATTIIDGGGSGNVVTITAASGVNFSGFTVQNSGTTAVDAGIFILVATGCTVTANEITGNTHGIGMYLGSGNAITSNDINNNAGYGVALAGSSGNTIELNTIANIGLDAIALDNAKAFGGLEEIGSNGNYIKTNTISDIARDGIFLGENCGGNFITDGNNLSHITGIAISVWRPSSQTITNNVISDAATGIRLLGSSNNVITGNTITGCGEGIRANRSWQVGAWYPCANNDISFNNISGNTHGIDASENTGTAVDATSNWWGSASGPTHASNPGGSGDAISDNVKYSPWLGATQQTTPRTFYVNTTGTIQEAIDAASAGDTINVLAGTYDVDASWDGSKCCIYIDKNLTLSGAGSGSTILDAKHTYSCVNGPPCGPHCTVIWNETLDVTMSGLTVKGGDWGIRNIANGMSATFNDVVVTDNYGHGFVFENNSVDTVTFNNCKADANGDRGIYFSPGCTATNVSLNNTNADGNKHIGFNCQGSITNLSITGGAFNNNAGGYCQLKCDEQSTAYYGFGIELEDCVGTIDGVTAQDNGGDPQAPVEKGAGINIKGASSSVTIMDSLLTGNPIGLWLENWMGTQPSPAAVAINNSNVVGNIDFGVKNDCTGVTVDATNNWWGANDGPGPVGPGSGDAVSANVDYDPWLVLNISADPTSIVVGGAATSAITADMTKNSDDVDISAQGHIPDGTQITFTTDKGSIGSLTVDKTTTSGIATATLTSSNNTVETATVTASAPPHTVAATVSTTVNFVPQPTESATGTGTVTFNVDAGWITGLTAVAEGTLPTAGKPETVAFLHGLFSFNIIGIAPGSTVTVTITYPSAMPVGTQYWKCQGGVWVDCTSLLGDDDGDNVLTLTLTDGGLGDADGFADGTIVDPGGPGVGFGGTGGWGGGGGGGAPSGTVASVYTATLTVNMQGNIATVKMTNDGVLGETLIARDTAGKYRLEIDKDARVMLAGNKVPLLLRFREASTTPPAPENAVIVGTVYELNAYSSTSSTTPSPVTISPPARLILTYDPDKLPKNVSEVFIANYDTEKGWLALAQASGVVAEIGKAQCQVSHFSVFAVLAKTTEPALAKFNVGKLIVSPSQAKLNQEVNISVNVANNGGTSGSYSLELKVNGISESTKQVTVAAGTSQTVNFTITEAQSGTYTVDIAGQRGSFVVLGAGAPLNSGLIAVLIVGALILATVVVLLVTFRRRRAH